MVINHKQIEKVIKDAKSLNDDLEMIELSIQEIRDAAIEEEKVEVQKVKEKVKEKMEKSMKKYTDRLASCEAKKAELDEKKISMIGQLYMKKSKEQLSDDETNLLNQLTSM
jgi:histidinol dehydrogenase